MGAQHLLGAKGQLAGEPCGEAVVEEKGPVAHGLPQAGAESVSSYSRGHRPRCQARTPLCVLRVSPIE